MWLKIGRRIFLGFMSIFGVFVLINTYFFFEMQNLSNTLGEIMHGHPEFEMIKTEIVSTQIEIIILSFFILFLVLLVSTLITRSVSQPIHELILAIRRFTSGTKIRPIIIRRKDEIGELTISFNAMMTALRKNHLELENTNADLEIKISERTKELEEERKSLEEKVALRTKELEEERASLKTTVEERTKNLQQKLDELNKFKTLTLNRELKMVELKKTIEKLENQIAENT